MKRLDNELLVGKQSAVAEARALYRMLGPEQTAEELRELIAIPPKIERACCAASSWRDPQDAFKLALLCSFLLIVWLQISQSTFAQEKPDAPKPKHDGKVFFAGISLLAASKTADAITTRQVLDRGGWESNPVFGRHPSPAKQAGINLGIFAAQSTAFYFTERSRHRWIRWTGRALIGHEILEHSRLAACNAGINVQAAQIQNCRPVVSGL